MIYDINTLTISPNDYILLTYDTNQIDLEKIKGIFDMFREVFSGKNQILVIPKSINMTVHKKSELIEYLKKILSELEDNND